MCTSILDAIRSFFLYGLQPGSCTTYLLLEQFNIALTCAHPTLTQGDNWEHTVNVVKQIVPACIKGSNFATWPGFVNLSADEKEQVRLMATLTDDLSLEWCNNA